MDAAMIADNSRIKRGKASKWTKPRVRLYTNGMAAISNHARMVFVTQELLLCNSPAIFSTEWIETNVSQSFVQQALTSWYCQ